MLDTIPQLAPHDIRQRTAAIRDRLRAIGRHVPLMCDSMYERGEFSWQQWDDLHLFRQDQVQLREAQLKGMVRLPRPADAKQFRMPNYGIARAVACLEIMSGHCYDVALILVGIKDGQVERMEALNAAWQVAQMYRGNAGRERWRD